MLASGNQPSQRSYTHQGLAVHSIPASHPTMASFPITIDLQAVHDINLEIPQFAASATFSTYGTYTSYYSYPRYYHRLGPSISCILASRDHSEDPLLVLFKAVYPSAQPVHLALSVLVFHRNHCLTRNCCFGYCFFIIYSFQLRLPAYFPSSPVFSRSMG